MGDITVEKKLYINGIFFTKFNEPKLTSAGRYFLRILLFSNGDVHKALKNMMPYLNVAAATL